MGLSPGTSYTGSASVTRTGVDHITDSAAATAQSDLVTAYNDLSVPPATTLGAPDLAGQTLLPGTYTTDSGTFANSGTVILDGRGDPSAVFIFRAASTVITSTNSTMVLANGAQACNVYWQVGSSATIGVNSTYVGHVYALTSITANTGATISGQLLARNGAVTLDTNTIVNDRCVTVAATTTTSSTVAATTSTVSGGTTSTTPAFVTTVASPTVTTPAIGTVNQLPNTGINGLIWLVGLIFIIGLILGVIRIRG